MGDPPPGGRAPVEEKTPAPVDNFVWSFKAGLLSRAVKVVLAAPSISWRGGGLLEPPEAKLAQAARALGQN